MPQEGARPSRRTGEQRGSCAQPATHGAPCVISFSLTLSSVLRRESHESSSGESSSDGVARASSTSSLLINTPLSAINVSSANSETERRVELQSKNIVDLKRENSSLGAELVVYKDCCAVLREDEARLEAALTASSDELEKSKLRCAELERQVYEMNEEMEGLRSNKRAAKLQMKLHRDNEVLELKKELAELEAAQALKVNLPTRRCYFAAASEFSPLSSCWSDCLCQCTTQEEEPGMDTSASELLFKVSEFLNLTLFCCKRCLRFTNQYIYLCFLPQTLQLLETRKVVMMHPGLRDLGRCTEEHLQGLGTLEVLGSGGFGGVFKFTTPFGTFAYKRMTVSSVYQPFTETALCDPPPCQISFKFFSVTQEDNGGRPLEAEVILAQANNVNVHALVYGNPGSGEEGLVVGFVMDLKWNTYEFARRT